MPYIYKITNQINGKIYIGKTVETIEARFQRHCRDYKLPSINHRPLYNAMKKYGIENFNVTLLEECSIDSLNDREKFWIEVLGAFKNGYNATKGGDGVAYADYDLIFILWEKGNSMRDIQKITNYSLPTIRNALNNFHISKEQRIQHGIDSNSKMVQMIDIKSNQVIKIFSSATEAGRSLGKQNGSHISDVCKGKRKTAYGYKWEYLNN